MTPSASRCCSVLAATVAWLTMACGSGGSGPTGPPPPTIQKTGAASGDSQTGPVAAALSNPLRVLVTLSGSPQPGQSVTWAAAGTAASVSPATSVTDATGIATTTWTLGQTAGGQSATATLSGATGSPVTFTATATAGSATQLTLSSGDNQTGGLNSPLANPLKVKAGDQFGNGVSGVGIAWQVTSGSASVLPTNSNTDASGLAQTTVTLGGTAGPVTVTAASAGLVGSPVTFHATGAAFPTSAAVQIGDIFFKSGANATQNPAVDTIAAGGTVTWTWGGSLSHSAQSTGSPTFTSSTIKSSGTYSVTFTTAGTYSYDCAVHGQSMTGRVVVR